MGIYTDLLGSITPKESFAGALFRQRTRSTSNQGQFHREVAWQSSWNPGPVNQQTRRSRLFVRGKSNSWQSEPRKWYIDKQGLPIERVPSQPMLPGFLIYSPEHNLYQMEWATLSDHVIGGDSVVRFNASSGIWSGRLGSSKAGFTGIKSELAVPLDMVICSGFRITVRGQGQRFRVVIHDDDAFNSIAWSYSLDTNKTSDTIVDIKLSELVPFDLGKVQDSARPLNVAAITSLQFAFSKKELYANPDPYFEMGGFQLAVKRIETF